MEMREVEIRTCVQACYTYLQADAIVIDGYLSSEEGCTNRGWNSVGENMTHMSNQYGGFSLKILKNRSSSQDDWLHLWSSTRRRYIGILGTPYVIIPSLTYALGTQHDDFGLQILNFSAAHGIVAPICVIREIICDQGRTRDAAPASQPAHCERVPTASNEPRHELSESSVSVEDMNSEVTAMEGVTGADCVAIWVHKWSKSLTDPLVGVILSYGHLEFLTRSFSLTAESFVISPMTRSLVRSVDRLAINLKKSIIFYWSFLLNATQRRHCIEIRILYLTARSVLSSVCSVESGTMKIRNGISRSMEV